MKNITLIFITILFSQATFARLPGAPKATPAPKENAKIAKDYTDTICQLVVEGNLEALNTKIHSGALGKNKLTILGTLNKLGVPNGKGCIVNVFGALHTSLKKKGVDPQAELERLKSLARQGDAAEQIRKEYPNLNSKQTEKIASVLKAFDEYESYSTTRVGEIELPANVQQ